MKAAYYNENDPFAAAWLRELIKAGLIADGDVDERSIEDVAASDLAGYRQCHFFAGIGGWSYALRLAGWPDDREAWTGSCPCQPWSVAGQRKGSDDSRDLWYAWFRLIRECRPNVVFGEQVASPAASWWIDRFCADVEHVSYAVGAGVLPAASVGTPQGRHRIWFVANADDTRWQRAKRKGQPNETAWEERPAARREPVRPVGRPWPEGPGAVDRIPSMANGLPGVMGGCKGYGNAIVPPLAAEFIKAYLEVSA